MFDLLVPVPRVVASAAARAVAAGEAGSPIRLLFPLLGAVQGDGPVLLRAMGGRHPLKFPVNETPVPGVAAQREASWVSDGPGFYAVTVLDADREGARVPVRMR